MNARGTLSKATEAQWNVKTAKLVLELTVKDRSWKQTVNVCYLQMIHLIIFNQASTNWSQFMGWSSLFTNKQTFLLDFQLVEYFLMFYFNQGKNCKFSRSIYLAEFIEIKNITC